MRTTRGFVAALTVCVFLALLGGAAAEVSLSGIFGDHMVLQRDRAIPVWGWAKPGEQVTVSLAGQTRTTVAAADGAWRVDLEPLSVNATGDTLVVEGTNRIEIADVLVGEVWICSGQSNMEWPLSGAENGAQEVASANDPLLRLINLPHIVFALPQETVTAKWAPCMPSSVRGFSAVGYCFGRKLRSELNVPIGLIGASWSGSLIEPWIPPVGFHSVPELAELSARVNLWDARTPSGLAAFQEALEKVEAWVSECAQALVEGRRPVAQPLMPGPGPGPGEPTVIYNGLIHPLAPFAVRGAIWYQGESNGGERESYFHKMQALINGWRAVFENPALSFYFVQLANYHADSGTPAGNTGYAGIRDWQRRALSIPNTGMALAIDIGNPDNIHPLNKQDVGLRLALWALARDYGQDIVCSGPLYREHAIEGNTIRLHFDHVGGGLMVGRKNGLAPTQETAGEPLKRFAVSDTGGKWHWADAEIDGDTVVASSPDVPEPVAVRYAYDANPAGCNLYNREGLPASPFTTE